MFQDHGERDLEPSLLLILKWGGELTSDGKVQAEDLGTAFSNFKFNCNCNRLKKIN